MFREQTDHLGGRRGGAPRTWRSRLWRAAWDVRGAPGPSHVRRSAQTAVIRALVRARGDSLREIPVKVGTARMLQHMCDPCAPFVVDRPQLPDTGRRAICWHSLQVCGAQRGTQQPVVHDVEFPPADEDPQRLGATVHDDEPGAAACLRKGRLGQHAFGGYQRSLCLRAAWQFIRGADTDDLYLPAGAGLHPNKLRPAGLISRHGQRNTSTHLTTPTRSLPAAWLNTV